MKAVLRLYDRLLAGLALLSALAFGAVAFIIAYEVSTRWLGYRPPVWPQAISEYTMLYATLFGAPWILRRAEHVQVTTLAAVLPAGARKALSRAMSIIGMVVCLVVAWYALRVTLTAPGLEIRSFEMPKWWEMREGVTIPAIPIGKPKEGGQGYVPERNPYFKKFTTRTMRPVIDFDTCVKCNLCWIACPDSVFDVMPDGTFDPAMEACCGCGVCEAVCPVENCITMVNESAFEDNASQWEMWRQDKGVYKTWLLAKIGDKPTTARSHGFRFRGQYEEQVPDMLQIARQG